jgi:hypothetical protein
MKYIFAFGSMVLIASFAWAEDISYSSTSEQTQFIELYTSEGCSSCPPADKILSALIDHPDLWKSIIPVAFHVDYWDYIGWKDPFAQAANSLRQRTYAQQGNLSQPYTPNFMHNGNEWRNWRDINNTPLTNNSPGKLSITIKDDSFMSGFNSTQLIKPQQLNVGILGFDLSTTVTAGENQGKVLTHHFVLLALTSFSANNNQWQGKLPSIPKRFAQGKRYAVVAWVSDTSNLKPIQTVGGWLPK